MASHTNPDTKPVLPGKRHSYFTYPCCACINHRIQHKLVHFVPQLLELIGNYYLCSVRSYFSHAWLINTLHDTTDTATLVVRGHTESVPLGNLRVHIYIHTYIIIVTVIVIYFTFHSISTDTESVCMALVTV